MIKRVAYATISIWFLRLEEIRLRGNRLTGEGYEGELRNMCP